MCNETLLIVDTFALRKARIVHNFGLSECNRVKRFLPPVEILSGTAKSASMSLTHLAIWAPLNIETKVSEPTV